MEKKEKQTKTCTYIGGQAVMEGVMMRGKLAMATAVRDPEGTIQIESERLTPPEKKNKFLRLPFVRGVVNFISSLVDGNRILMRSADVAMGEEETQTKAEKWLEEKHKINLSGILSGAAVVIGVVLALAIFLWLPQWIMGLSFMPFDVTSKGWDGLWFNLIEGGIRLLIFILYVFIIGLFPDLKRVYKYHGAEHKTITCFEEGKQLTVENVRGCKRVHDRCGTTFLFLVMMVSILIFSVVNVLAGQFLYIEGEKTINSLIRFGLKILMLPVVAGISYEVLRLLARAKSKFWYIFKFPGLLLQRITTREPSDDMIECAIAAFNTVLAMDADPTIGVKVFATAGKMSELLKSTKSRFADAGIEEDEAEWIFALTLDIPKSAVNGEERIIKLSQAKKILKIVEERLTGRPLWYVIGDTDFYGYKIKVDERVLIPRPETEELAQVVIGCAEEGNEILDLCTGSGAIAIAVYKELEKSGRKCSVTASDISEGALALAKENAQNNEADIKFVQSDLFKKVRGRYEIIVSNPPYIPSSEIPNLQREVKDFEPVSALDGGEDGMDFYRRIADEVGKYIAQGGALIMEVGAGQAQDVIKLFKRCDYTMIMKDFAGVDRFVKIVF
ncbi:MAG: peptide chain release factor N(5)-glutamine methyltransferase [Clostridia bacterium]|nr:peptide chain release factor N(5)-glutamine methyltransferase [Clostridia bacterium]